MDRKIDIKEAVIAYNSGKTAAEVASMFNASHQCTLKALRKAGVTIRPPNRGSKPRFTEPQAIKVVDLYKSGLPIIEVKNQTSINRNTILRILHTNNVAMRPKGLKKRSIIIPDDAIKLAYFAGIFDGEGNVQVRYKENRKIVSGKLAIYNTEPNIMNWLETNFGGKLRWDHARVKRSGWKPIGIWEVHRIHDIVILLRTIIPFLIIKKAQAIHLLSLLDCQFKLP